MFSQKLNETIEGPSLIRKVALQIENFRLIVWGYLLCPVGNQIGII